MKGSVVVGCVCLMSLSLVAATAVDAAQERKCRDIGFPEHVQVNGSDLALNGLGVRKATFLKINVYVAALYVAHPQRNPTVLVDSDTAQELVLHFVRDVGAADLRKAFLEAFERAPPLSASLQERIAKLNSWMVDVKTGQRMTFVRLPHTGVQVSVNGVPRGTIEGDDFARAFISIWLGPEPPNPELKSGLLGGDCA
jgi:chalcone isomerase-like protein